MFFAQLNERNTMVKSILPFEKVEKSHLSRLGESAKSTLAESDPQKAIFFVRVPNVMI
jgi:hypothetical protein